MKENWETVESWRFEWKLALRSRPRIRRVLWLSVFVLSNVGLIFFKQSLTAFSLAQSCSLPSRVDRWLFAPKTDQDTVLIRGFSGKILWIMWGWGVVKKREPFISLWSNFERQCPNFCITIVCVCVCSVFCGSWWVCLEYRLGLRLIEMKANHNGAHSCELLNNSAQENKSKLMFFLTTGFLSLGCCFLWLCILFLWEDIFQPVTKSEPSIQETQQFDSFLANF